MWKGKRMPSDERMKGGKRNEFVTISVGPRLKITMV